MCSRAALKRVPSCLHCFIFHKDFEAVQGVSWKERELEKIGPLFLKEACGAVCGVSAGCVGNEYTRLGVLNGCTAESWADNFQLLELFRSGPLRKDFGIV